MSIDILKMYMIRESNLVKNKVEDFLKSCKLSYYAENYIKSINPLLTEIDFVFNVNNSYVCILNKFISPAPSSSTIVKFIQNLKFIQQITSSPVYGVLLLRANISADSEFQLKTCGIDIMIINNNERNILLKQFYQYMYLNGVYIKDGDDIMMLEPV